jgi:hypothetical protein
LRPVVGDAIFDCVDAYFKFLCGIRSCS